MKPGADGGNPNDDAAITIESSTLLLRRTRLSVSDKSVNDKGRQPSLSSSTLLCMYNKFAITGPFYSLLVDRYLSWSSPL